jgi:hypothetical protein
MAPDVKTEPIVEAEVIELDTEEPPPMITHASPSKRMPAMQSYFNIEVDGRMVSARSTLGNGGPAVPPPRGGTAGPMNGRERVKASTPGARAQSAKCSSASSPSP